jgi:Fic family protein
MVSLKKQKLGNKEYYYLHHSFRINGTIRTKELYLGETLPKDLENKKREFLHCIFKEKWFVYFDRILEKYSKEMKKTPRSALEKDTMIFSIRFTYDTNRIEGSTLTLRETADLLERGITPPSRPLNDVKETEAHRDLFYEILNFKKDLDFHVMLHWHKRLLERTKPDIAGRIRDHQVMISGSRFIPPLSVELHTLLMDFFKWYNKAKIKIHPVELAALVHLKFVSIHPFTDGNGRISRLMMNFVLHKHGFPMLNIHYEKRGGYYRALERAHLQNDETIFLNWFFKRYLKEFKGYL